MTTAFTHPGRLRLAFVLATGAIVLAPASAVAASGPGANLDGLAMAFGLLGGLAIFLFGMEQMTDALKAVAGDRLRDILGRLTTNRLTGAATGAVVTAIIQSSSVTTVLTVGFITAGIMSLSQAVGVIFGANLGTTITAQVVAFQVTEYALPVVTLGFGMLFLSSRDSVRQYGAMVMGLGLIFFGMGLMSSAMRPLRTFEPFVDLMARMETPLLGIAVAAAFTGIVQSSSATTGVVIAMASQGLISLSAGIALIFGANIGTCVTAMLASIGKPREAVRAAVVHILFNVVGVLLWVGFIDELSRLVVWLSPGAADLSGHDRLAAETPRQIANAHTVFNVANTLLFLPLGGLFARVVERLVSDPIEAGPTADPAQQRTQWHLDPALLAVPAVALAQARGGIQRMACAVRHMLTDIMPVFDTNDLETAREILERDRQVDELEERLTDFLVQISRQSLGRDQARETVQLLNITKDLEHIGDLIERNVIDLLRKKADAGAFFSAAGRQELTEYHRRVLASFDQAVAAVDRQEVALARQVVATKAELVELEWQYRKTHYDRLSRALQESVETSQIHLELMDYLRRIDSYVESIAKSVIAGNGPATETTEEVSGWHDDPSQPIGSQA